MIFYYAASYLLSVLLECKLHEDKDFTLFMIISPEPRKEPGMKWVLSDYLFHGLINKRDLAYFTIPHDISDMWLRNGKRL